MNPIDKDAIIDSAESRIQSYNESMRRKCARTGLKPPQKESIVANLNVRVYKPLFDSLREVSTKTGISQRRLVQDALVEYLEQFQRKFKGSAFSRRG